MPVNLASQILKSPGETFPFRKRPVDFQSHNLRGLAINRFDNFRVAKLHRNVTLYLGGPTDSPEEISKYIEGRFEGLYYVDKNNDKSYDPRIDEKLADVRLFISHDGAFLLKQHHALDQRLAPDEVAIFLEVPKGDIFSGTVMLIRAGENAKKHAKTILKHEFITDRYELTEDQVSDLLESLSSGQSLWEKAVSVMVSIKHAVVSKIAELGAGLFELIADFFNDNLRIDESVWNSGHPDYGFGKFEDIVTGFLDEQAARIDQFINDYAPYLPDWSVAILRLPSRALHGLADALNAFRGLAEVYFAFNCGLWNGLIDLVSAIFALLKLVFEGIAAANKYDENRDYYNSIAVEYFDNFLEAVMKIDWIKVAVQMLESVAELIAWIGGLPTKLMEALAKVNQTEIGYFLGYVIFQVVEFIFPPLKLAKLGKATKLEKVVGLFGDLAGKVAKGGKAAGKAVEKGTRNMAEVFFEMVEGFVAKLNEGTQAYAKWLGEIFRAIRKWVDDALGGYFKTSDEVDVLFHKGQKTVNGGKVLSWNALLKFKHDLEFKYRHLNLQVEIITNSRRYASLIQKWEKRGVLGTFSAGSAGRPPKIRVRAETTRLTIQHEVWHLEDLERLGYNEYKKTPKWMHEASVWEKTWATRKSWGEIELISAWWYYALVLEKAGKEPVLLDEMIELLLKNKDKVKWIQL